MCWVSQGQLAMRTGCYCWDNLVWGGWSSRVGATVEELPTGCVDTGAAWEVLLLMAEFAHQVYQWWSWLGKVPGLVEACAIVVMSFLPIIHHTEGVGPDHLPTRCGFFFKSWVVEKSVQLVFRSFSMRIALYVIESFGVSIGGTELRIYLLRHLDSPTTQRTDQKILKLNMHKVHCIFLLVYSLHITIY